MKRNRLTLLWLLVMVMVMLFVWFAPTYFNPIQVASESDVNQDEAMKWERINVFLEDKDNPNGFILSKYYDNHFSYNQADINSVSGYNQALCDEVYSDFSIINRPNLRDYQIMAISETQQFWYKSPYLFNQDDDALTFTYTIIDRENADYIESAYDFEDQSLNNYYFLGYAEEADHYFVLLEFYYEQLEQSVMHQLSIDKISGEVVQEEKIEYVGEYSSGFIPFYQKNNPSYQVVGLTQEPIHDNSLISFDYAQRDRRLLVINPKTKEMLEIEAPYFNEANPSESGGRTVPIMVDDKLYYLRNDINVQDEATQPQNELTMYQYDWDKEEFIEIWAKELDVDTIFTVQFKQIYLTTIEDENHARIESMQLDTGESEVIKRFVIDSSSNYEFSSLNFAELY